MLEYRQDQNKNLTTEGLHRDITKYKDIAGSNNAVNNTIYHDDSFVS